MNQLIIILQQTRMSAILEILLILLVAGIIGYLTAYFFYKSVYTKRIQFLEGEKHELKKHIETLFIEKAKLDQTIKDLESEIEATKNPGKKEQ